MDTRRRNLVYYLNSWNTTLVRLIESHSLIFPYHAFVRKHIDECTSSGTNDGGHIRKATLAYLVSPPN